MNEVLKRKCVVLIFISLPLLFFACSGKHLKTSTDSTLSSTPAPQDKNAPRYYDFVDVLVPGELKMDNKSTYVVQVAGAATGILVMDGWVERNSLISFFQTNMAKDNWEAISFFKSPRTSSFLLYKKANRWCVISISDKDFSTHVEIGVAPAAEKDAAGLYR